MCLSVYYFRTMKIHPETAVSCNRAATGMALWKMQVLHCYAVSIQDLSQEQYSKFFFFLLPVVYDAREHNIYTSEQFYFVVMQL